MRKFIELIVRNIKRVAQTSLCACLAFLVLSGCATQADVNNAMTKLDAIWKVENDRIIAADGTKEFHAAKYQAFLAAQGASRRIGMIVENAQLDNGYIYAVVPAPTLFDAAEWETVKATDTAEAQRVIAATPPQSPTTSSARSVQMRNNGDTYVVPVIINNAITLDFIVDSGASDVSIPADVFLTLMRTGTIQDSDFLRRSAHQRPRRSAHGRQGSPANPCFRDASSASWNASARNGTLV
jgi:hypothetical protein